jgi:hypothetical protein
MSTQPSRGSLGGPSRPGTDSMTVGSSNDVGDAPAGAIVAPELFRSLAQVKGQAQFLLYLADQIEESLVQLTGEADASHGAFLCKILGMYSSQLESKHQGLGDKIAETCQEVYVTVREYDAV